MEIVLERGRVATLNGPDKQGAVSGRVGRRNVKIHGDIANKLSQGDDVLVGGTMNNNVLEVVAMKSYKQDKVDGSDVEQVDCTNFILLMGLGGLLFMLCGVFSMQGVMYPWVNTNMGVISFAGFIGMFLALRRFVRIITVARRVMV